MLSHNGGRYVEESIRSVMAQTYQNWELLFIDDSSKDGSIAKAQELQTEDYEGRKFLNGEWHNIREVSRIHVSVTSDIRGEAENRNSALKNAEGRWIAFLNVGDVWSRDKLEKQVAFMEENGYAFTYTQYGLMDADSNDRGFVIGGKELVTESDMHKCCWPAYLTVMYDREKVGLKRVRAPKNNDYSLLLHISENDDCHLLPLNLATRRTKWNKLGNFLLTNSVKWRYDAYRYDEYFGRTKSLLFTVRNLAYGLVKWWKYAKKVK